MTYTVNGTILTKYQLQVKVKDWILLNIGFHNKKKGLIEVAKLNKQCKADNSICEYRLVKLNSIKIVYECEVIK